MKIVIIEIALVFILFEGCSTTYRVTDFPSKEKFYGECNKNFKDNEASIILVNDSTLASPKGFEIKHDTLFTYVNLEEKIIRQFALSDIAELQFSGNSTASAFIVLKNGSKFDGVNATVTKDSIMFVEIKNIVQAKPLVPIDEIKIISHKDRWRRMPLGVLAGAPLGFLSGFALVNIFKIKDYHGQADYFGTSLQMTVVGVLAGCITSYLIGFNEIYQFNP